MTRTILSMLARRPPRPGRRLGGDESGNIMMMMAFALVPLTFALGFGLDYSRAEKLQTQLNAAADAAALAAVDPSMLCQTSATAQAAAVAAFQSQAASLPGIAGYTTGYNPQVTVTPTSASASCSGTLRTATVTYKATSKNEFSSILGVANLPISGTAIADASQPPSINFYVAMDFSPSMLLPTTTAGINSLNSSAIWKGANAYGWPVVGCDFACHSTNMQTWNYGVFPIDSHSNSLYLDASSNLYRLSCTNGTVYNSSGTQIGTNGSVNVNVNQTSCGNGTSAPPSGSITLSYKPTGSSSSTNVTVTYPDTWWLARNFATVNPGQSQIQLRIDAEGLAGANLIQYAYGVEQEYSSSGSPPVYKMQFFKFDFGTPTAFTTANLSTMTDVATSRSTAFPDVGLYAPQMAGIGCWTSTCYGSDAFTAFTDTLGGMATFMPLTPGTGTQASPQNVLILITDGANDDMEGNGMTELTTAQVAQCTAIKATGTKIAILYTQYMPNTINYTGDATFNNFNTNHVPNIQQQLQACATQNPDGTYLMETVPTDGDISAALNTLFSMVVQAARLVQ